MKGGSPSIPPPMFPVIPTTFPKHKNPTSPGSKAYIFQKAKKGHKLAIVAFGGIERRFGSIPPAEFLSFLKSLTDEADLYFFNDLDGVWYQRGIQGISKDIPSTVKVLKKKLNNYDRIIFMGFSSGGYAAILFGSILKVDKVIAFIPQTILTGGQKTDKKYHNLNKFINPNTSYILYCECNGVRYHHRIHCDNISYYPNVKVVNHSHIYLPDMKDNGTLQTLLKEELREDYL